MCMQSVFEDRKREIGTVLKLIMKKFVFERHTLDTDSVSISKKKLTNRTDRQ